MLPQGAMAVLQAVLSLSNCELLLACDVARQAAVTFIRTPVPSPSCQSKAQLPPTSTLPHVLSSFFATPPRP